VYIGTKNILAGTRTGDIYELLRPRESELKAKNTTYENMVINRLSCNNNEIPKSVGFSHKMDHLYALTQKGLFCVWSIKTLQLQYSHNFQRNTVSMIVFKNKPWILLVFETEVIISYYTN